MATIPVNSIFKTFPPDPAEKLKSDVHSKKMFDMSYLKYFLISADKPHKDVVAYVPIVPSPRAGFLLKILYNFIIVCGIISTFLLSLVYCKIGNGQIKVFGIAQLFLNQPVDSQPQKVAARMIMMIVVFTSIIIMNDILSDIISSTFEKIEKVFETYKDLYDLKLPIYLKSKYRFLKDSERMKNINDTYLLKILNESLVMDNIDKCLDMLDAWKNVTCIAAPTILDMVISYYLDPDGSPTMKVAQPPIFTEPLGFYWFADGSPYAMKFLEIMRRVKETALMHWPALVEKNRLVYKIDEISVTIGDKIKLEQLVPILSFGFFMSIAVFAFEFIVEVSKRKISEFSL